MARKSEIRASARAGLDALMKVGQAEDEQAAAKHLQEALEHIVQAAEGISLREATVAGMQDGSSTRRTRTTPQTGLEPLEEADYSTDQRIAFAKRGHAIPVTNDAGDIVGGRYPIQTRADVHNAILDADRSGAGAEERRHIVKNARRVGASGLIPSSWGGGKKGKARESAPLTLREAVAIGETSLLEALRPDVQEDPRLGLLDRMGIRDELGS